MTDIQNRTASESRMPAADRDADRVAGHWLLARLGKRVLRPGGIELTRTLLRRANLADADVLEFAPGMGRTATEIIEAGPRSYVGAEQNPDAARMVTNIVSGHGEVRVTDAENTGLPDASRDVVIGEAMLTMQGETSKNAIVAEAARVLRPGGRYAIHELALTPDSLSEDIKSDVQQALARAIKVNARPLTIAEWTQLLNDHGLVVDEVDTAPMALLQPRRLVSDEGLFGALRFAKNLLLQPDARRRVLTMRGVFRKYNRQMAGVAIVAHKPVADS